MSEVGEVVFAFSAITATVVETMARQNIISRDGFAQQMEKLKADSLEGSISWQVFDGIAKGLCQAAPQAIKKVKPVFKVVTSGASEHKADDNAGS